MREYVGCGLVAERATEADLEVRRVRDERRAAEKAERKALEDIDLATTPSSDETQPEVIIFTMS